MNYLECIPLTLFDRITVWIIKIKRERKGSANKIKFIVSFIVLPIHVLPVHVLPIHVLPIDLLPIHLLPIDLLPLHLLPVHVLQIQSTPLQSLFYHMPSNILYKGTSFSGRFALRCRGFATFLFHEKFNL